MKFSDYPTKERIKAFYSLWFDLNPYVFLDGESWTCMWFIQTNEWNTFKDYMNYTLSASECMRGISEEDIIGEDNIYWCFVNKDKILVVYCGEEFNLEIKYDSVLKDFVYRSFKY